MLSLEALTRTLQSRDMTRERLVGCYEADLGIDIIALALAGLEKDGKFVWYDMCCGKFNAGRCVSYESGRRAVCVGVDADTLLGLPVQDIDTNCRIERADVTGYQLPGDVDLVTCNKGLRYIEQYFSRTVVLDTVRRWYDALPVGARLVAEACDRTSWYQLSPDLIDAFGAESVRYSGNGCQVIDMVKTPTLASEVGLGHI